MGFHSHSPQGKWRNRDQCLKWHRMVRNFRSTSDLIRKSGSRYSAAVNANIMLYDRLTNLVTRHETMNAKWLTGQHIAEIYSVMLQAKVKCKQFFSKAQVSCNWTQRALTANIRWDLRLKLRTVVVTPQRRLLKAMLSNATCEGHS